MEFTFEVFESLTNIPAMYLISLFKIKDGEPVANLVIPQLFADPEDAKKEGYRLITRYSEMYSDGFPVEGWNIW